eukprot:351766-Amphidinium_carterae.1
MQCALCGQQQADLTHRIGHCPAHSKLRAEMAPQLGTSGDMNAWAHLNFELPHRAHYPGPEMRPVIESTGCQTWEPRSTQTEPVSIASMQP